VRHPESYIKGTQQVPNQRWHMDLTRREFIGSVSAAAAVKGLPGQALSAEEGKTMSSSSSFSLSSADDPLGVRGDFPIVEENIYLDSAYITPSPTPAVRAAQNFLEAKGRDPVSLGGMLDETNSVRRRFARLIGATEPEIGVLLATSDGENIIARALDLGRGDNVVIDDLHYETTFILYQKLAESRGLEVRIVPSQGGVASAEAFARYVDKNTRLVSVAWISHQNGFRHDLEALAELAHAHGAFLYADAIQGIGMLDLDVKSVGIDFFTAGTYKCWAASGWLPSTFGNRWSTWCPPTGMAPFRWLRTWAGTATDYTKTRRSTAMPPWRSVRSFNSEARWTT